jgi:hypothetical protein
LPIVCENPKDIESNESKDTNMYILVDNEPVKASSKRQKIFSSLTPQNRNTNTATLDYGASCSYTITVNNLTVNLKEYADSNWDSDIICPISDQRIPRSLKMQVVFKFKQII